MDNKIVSPSNKKTFGEKTSAIERRRGRPKKGEEAELFDKKKVLTKLEKDFLTKFAFIYNRVKAMKETIGIQYDENGLERSDDYYYMKASKLLKNQYAKDYVRELQKEINLQNCHTLEKAIEETYSFYELLIGKKNFHAANVAYERYVNLCGFLNQSAKDKVQVNTQIIAGDKQITINYIKPGEDTEELNIS